METIIYGASDDLLEVSGKYSEEFGAPSDEKFFVAVSDGTLLEVEYDGEWKFRAKVKGTALKEIVQAVGDEGEHKGYEKYTSYSDLCIFSGAIAWVAIAEKATKF